jgi:hypothetical protein
MAAVGIGDIGSGGPPLGGSDITGELGALLNDGYDAAAGESTEPAGDPGGEGGVEPSQPFEETPAEIPGETPASLAPETTPVESPWQLAPDGKSYLMPKGELPKVQSAIKYTEAVSQIYATPQEAQTAALQASDLRQITNDWMYGTDESIRGVLNHWAGGNHQDPAMRASFQRSFAKMATMAPEILKTVNPQAYSQFVATMGKSVVQSAYEKAARIGTPEALQEAQAVEWGLTGQYQKELPKQDPAAQAQQQWQREKQEFEARQQNALKRDVMSFNQTAVEGAKFTQLGTRIDALLAPVKGKFNEVAYNDLKAGIQREAIDAISKQEWFTEHRQNFDQLMADYRHTWTQGSPGQGLQPRVQAYIQDFLSRVSRVLPQIAQKRVNATTQARLGQQRPGPKPGTPRPTPAASNGQPPARLTRDQWDEEFAKTFQ